MILVSGFEAFGGETVNPTHRLVDELKARPRPNVEAVLLPVGFANAFETLREVISRLRPTSVLALGQAGGRANVEIERVAVNVKDAEIPDNNGEQPRDELIDPRGQTAYLTTLPMREIERALRARNIPVKISNTAGLYVCNYLFYRLQQLKLRQSGFIHFPYLPEQKEPSMPFAQMVEALDAILAALDA